MTNHRTIQPDARKVIIGVDTHKHVHVAVAIDTWGIRLGDRSCAADSDGYQQLITWAKRHGRVAAFGIEGTGSYGAGLARAVGPGWPIDRYPEDRGRGGRDDAPPQGRAPDGGQSPAPVTIAALNPLPMPHPLPTRSGMRRASRRGLQ